MPLRLASRLGQIYLQMIFKFRQVRLTYFENERLLVLIAFDFYFTVPATVMPLRLASRLGQIYRYLQTIFMKSQERLT